MRNKNVIGFFFTLALAAFCIIGLALSWLAIDLPRRAEKSFGKPAENLSLIEQAELAAKLLMQMDELKKPRNPGGEAIQFIIEQGESTYSITNRLEKMGLIRSSQALRNYLVYSGLDISLQTGDYSLSPGQNAMEIAWALQDATPSEVIFRILPGWRLEEIAAAIPTSGLEFSPDIFLQTVYQPPLDLPLMDQLPSGASLEGFLFPDSYRFPRKVDIETFLETVLSNFQLKVGAKDLEGFNNQGLGLFEAVTLASIIQRESVLEEEMPLIASVFFNRLDSGMKLETDPTVQYALGFDRRTKSWWKNPLSLEDLKIVSTYNTYVNAGLPPGPIANPGLVAIQAVAFPAQAPYYYFRSACNGSGKHNFSETFEEHRQNACPE